MPVLPRALPAGRKRSGPRAKLPPLARSRATAPGSRPSSSSSSSARGRPSSPRFARRATRPRTIRNRPSSGAGLPGSRQKSSNPRMPRASCPQFYPNNPARGFSFYCDLTAPFSEWRCHFGSRSMWSFPLARRRTAARASGRRLLMGALAALLVLLAAAPLGAAPRSVGEPVTEARLLKQLYLIGLGRMARGDPEAAVAPFQVVTEVAPELVEAQQLLAAAMVLSDFGRRRRALPIIDKALA